MELIIQWKVACPVCFKAFVIDNQDGVVPQHNETDKPTPCAGSGKLGTIIDRRAIPKKK